MANKVKALNKEKNVTIDKTIELLRQDSNFFGQSSNYSSHNFHAFAAKFPPQLPRTLIENLTDEGDIVLDPMVGSGTAIVEALLLGRHAIGFDIDPLAVHLSRIKTSKLDFEKIASYLNRIIANSTNNLSDSNNIENQLKNRYDSDTRKFMNFWFNETTQRELVALLLAIEALPGADIKEFYRLVFSSIIITKSGGVTLARDLAHTRPHKDHTKIPKNAIKTFTARSKKLLRGIVCVPHNGVSVRIGQNDAKNLPLDNESIDLIVTSPPYANAIDYMRAHKFSLIWFGISISELSSLRSKYIGSEKTSLMLDEELPNYCVSSIEKVKRLDAKKAKILQKYLREMKIALQEMNRVLKRGKCLILVVGNSTMRGCEVKTNKNLEAIGEVVGFAVRGQIIRQLDRSRRMLPTSINTNREGIEKRMHEEYILIFEKRVR